MEPQTASRPQNAGVVAPVRIASRNRRGASIGTDRYHPSVSPTRAQYAQGSQDVRKMHYESRGFSSYSPQKVTPRSNDESNLGPGVEDALPAGDAVYRDLGLSPKTPPGKVGVSELSKSKQDRHLSSGLVSLSAIEKNLSLHYPASSVAGKRPGKRLDDANTPILFGDPFETGSVMTGMSQQELLRKKAREDGSRHRRAKHPTRKKKRERILNMPVNLLGGGKKYYETRQVESTVLGLLPKKKVHAKVLDLHIRGDSSWAFPRGTPPSSAAEDIDLSTADSTNPGSADIPPGAYSAVPAQEAVVNEADGGAVLEWSHRPGDLQSIGEESFPILSNHPGSFGNGMEGDAEPERRGVRFSKKIVTTTNIYNENGSEIPWDEQADADDHSPTSVMNLATTRTQISVFELSNHTSSQQPKSILRPARFSPPSESKRITGTSRFSGLYALNEELLLFKGRHSTLSKSPPHGGNGFVERGVELSPIHKDEVGPRGPHHNVTLQREAVETLDEFYPDPPLMEEYSAYSDPTIELDTQFDDDSFLSTVAFIQSVAAIVVQTAFRRYRAVCALRMMQSKGISKASSKSVDQAVKFESMAVRMYYLAAVQIQAAYRGFWVRDCMSVDHYCAKLVQKMARGFLGRLNYRYDLFRITIVQSVCRMQLARWRAADMLGYVIVLQAAWRGFMVRKIVNSEVPNHQRSLSFASARNYANAVASAILIQAEWRRYTSESDFIRILIEVLIVQTVVRRWLARRRADYLRRLTAPRRWSQLPPTSRMGVRPPLFPTEIKREFKPDDMSLDISQDLSAIEVRESPFEADLDDRNIFQEYPVGSKTVLPTAEIDESPGGTKAFLSMWKDLDAQNSLVLGSKRRSMK